MKTYHITFIDKSIPAKEIEADGYKSLEGFVIFYKTKHEYIKVLSFPNTVVTHESIASYNSNHVFVITELNS